MIIRQSNPFGKRRNSALLSIVLAWGTGCTLQDIDHLGPGDSSAGGGKARGGSTSAGGTMSSTQGGSGAGQAGQSQENGGSAAGSSSSGGTTAGAAGAAGAAVMAAGTAGTSNDARCPPYTGTVGKLLTPPSANFETAGTWETVTKKPCQQTASAGATDGCQGAYYLTCATRIAAIDGPQFTVPVSDLLNGHRYYATALARFSPATAPTNATPLTMSVAMKCATGTQQLIPLGDVQYITKEWVRIGGEVTIDCTALQSSPSNMYFYVDTVVPQSPYLSVDVDDFRVYDLY